MSRLPQLEHELMRAARRIETGARAASQAPVPDNVRLSPTSRMATLRRLPAFAVATAVLLLAAAVAVAATYLIGTGAPVKPNRGQTFKPTEGFGVPKPGTVSLLPIAVPDPAGGPPWGMRFFQTTRGLGCVQVGRIVGGELGVLGQDGVFGNDGRFHPLPSNVLDRFGCVPLDAHGNAFLSLSRQPIDASGYQAGACLPAGDKRFARARIEVPACPTGPWRLVSYGLLGPQGRSVTYAAAGKSHTIRAVGRQGAYLIVLPAAQAPRTVTGPGFAPAVAPIQRVTYRDGTICTISSGRRLGGARPCPRVGYVPQPVRFPTEAQVASPVHTRIVHGRYRTELELIFRARLAVTGVDNDYAVEVDVPTSAHCGGTGLGGINRDVKAGEIVRFRWPLDPSACPGRYRGRIFYAAGPDTGPPLVPARVGPTVGRFSFRLPERPRPA